jgi:3-oxoacyl-[acyl-carrier-protein] synthase II
MIAGGSEKSTSPTTMAGFASMKALSTRNEDPTAASRPWDRHRDGFVLSDGAGAIVLEELEHAKARGADIYCELVGFGMSADASHMTSPAENGAGAARSMQAALKDAALNPESVDYINAHGTSTPLGDVAETEAIKQVFRDYAYQLRVSSTKSMMGHALGAAGAIEAVVTIKALQNNTAPPTINLDDPSDDCDLNYVAHSAQAQDIKVALSNSFGFGGTNGTVIFKSFDK